jgi:RimJ/RimL family protein N-acetyltransferase
MEAVERFQTERLRAERLRPEDYDDLLRLSQDARVTATLGGPRSAPETRKFLQDYIDHWARYGYGVWAFRDRAGDHFIGRAGLRNIRVGGRDEVELLYAVRAEEWGKGLATEMSEAILKVAFELLRLPDIVAFTLPTNRGSRRVMEKVGFRYERDIVHANLPHVLYRLTAAAKREARAPAP